MVLSEVVSNTTGSGDASDYSYGRVGRRILFPWHGQIRQSIPIDGHSRIGLLEDT